MLIKAGQYRTGRIKLSAETGLSEQQIRTCLKRLESTSEITIAKYNKFSVITITNWNQYQQKNEKSTSEITNNQPATNQQLTTNNNVNNKNNEKQNNKYIDQFEEFWNLYGIKKGRKKCEDKYRILLRDGVEHDKIMEGVRAYQNECIKLETEKEYIKLPLTFLNGRHWEDEYERERTRDEKLAEIQRNIGVLPCALTNS